VYGDLHEHGATVLATPISRMFVDVNRRRDDFEERDGEVRSRRGVVRTHTMRDVPLFARPLAPADLERRLRAHYDPYYATLDRLLDELRAQHGFAILLDGHTGSPRRMQDHQVIIGTRHGSTPPPAPPRHLARGGGGFVPPPRLRDPRECERLYRREHRGHGGTARHAAGTCAPDRDQLRAARQRHLGGADRFDLAGRRARARGGESRAGARLPRRSAARPTRRARPQALARIIRERRTCDRAGGGGGGGAARPGGAPPRP